MSWNNANFCLLSKKENAELYAQLYRDLKISADEFPEYLPGLVAVNNGSFLIKIIAPVVLYAQLYRDLKISADEFPEYLPGLVAVNNGSFLIKIIAPVVAMSNKPLL